MARRGQADEEGLDPGMAERVDEALNDDGPGLGAIRLKGQNIRDVQDFFRDVQEEERRYLQSAIDRDEQEDDEREREELAQLVDAGAGSGARTAVWDGRDGGEEEGSAPPIDPIGLTREEVISGERDNFRVHTAARSTTWQRVDSDEAARLREMRDLRLACLFYASERNRPFDARPVYQVAKYCTFAEHQGFGRVMRYMEMHSSRGHRVVKAVLYGGRPEDPKAILCNVIMLAEPGQSADTHPMDLRARFINFYVEHTALTSDMQDYFMAALSLDKT